MPSKLEGDRAQRAQEVITSVLDALGLSPLELRSVDHRFTPAGAVTVAVFRMGEVEIRHQPSTEKMRQDLTKFLRQIYRLP